MSEDERKKREEENIKWFLKAMGKSEKDIIREGNCITIINNPKSINE